jgi:hypothetical protein
MELLSLGPEHRLRRIVSSTSVQDLYTVEQLGNIQEANRAKT